MQQFAALRRQGDSTVVGRRILLEVHRDEVQAQLDELQHNLSAIEQKIQYYKILEQNNDSDKRARSLYSWIEQTE